MRLGRKSGIRGRAVCALAAVSLAVGLTGWAQAAETRVATVETFETGTNEGEWSWGTGTEYFVDFNGNPGRYLRESHLVTFTPRASTSFGLQSVFTGNYRDRNVASVGIDMAIASVDASVAGRTAGRWFVRGLLGEPARRDRRARHRPPTHRRRR